MHAKGIEGWIFVSVAALACLATMTLGLPHEVQVVLLVAMVALLGLPHGALDLDIARQAGLWTTSVQGLKFGLLYLAIVLASIGLWLFSPVAALSLFLTMSALHFSGDWRAQIGLAQRLVVGGGVIALPALFHGGEVAALFAMLVPEASAFAVSRALQVTGWALLAAIIFIARSIRHPRTRFEILGIVAAAAVLPPLVYFVVYFCFLHSPRHLIEAAADAGLETPQAVALRCGPIIGITWLGAILAALVVPATAYDSAAIQIVFIGLFALSVPHMALIEFWAQADQYAGGERF